jgi:hypothetical protein
MDSDAETRLSVGFPVKAFQVHEALGLSPLRHDQVMTFGVATVLS